MTFFHKGMTTEQRRRKVAEQARDSRGQWIEEGKNASTVINGKRYSGKVVGIYDGYAYLVPKKENPTHEPMPYRVPLKKVKMTNSKAVLPDKEKSRKARGAEALKGTKYEQMSDAEYAAEMERLDREYAKKIEAMLEGKATDEERQDRKEYREAIQDAKEAEKRGEIEPAPRTAPQREHSEQAKEATKSALSDYTAKVKEAYQGSRKDFTDVGHASYEDANGNKYYVSPRKEAEGPVMVVRDADMKELFNVPVNESDTDDSVAQKILDEYDSEIDDNDGEQENTSEDRPAGSEITDEDMDRINNRLADERENGRDVGDGWRAWTDYDELNLVDRREKKFEVDGKEYTAVVKHHSLPVGEPDSGEYEDYYTSYVRDADGNETKVSREFDSPEKARENAIKQVQEIADENQNKPETPAPENEPESDPLADITRNTPTAVGNEKFPPTQEQQDIIDATLAGKDVKVQALAGSGKTSTVMSIARRLPEGRRAGYIVFNKDAQTEAEERVKAEDLPIEARTGHSLAYAWATRNSKDTIRKLNSQDVIANAGQIADYLGIEKYKNSDKGEVARAIQSTVGQFQNSDKDNVRESGPSPELSSIFGSDSENLSKAMDKAEAYWNDLVDPDGRLRVTHDTYRKMWALSRPDLNSTSSGFKRTNDLIIIDEAQDTPPVLAKVVADQDSQKIAVGDENQAIYGFTGATDYLSQADADVELPLTKAWRFGPTLATTANHALALVDAKHRVVGGGSETKVTTDRLEDPDAILTRSNSGMISEAMTEMENGRSVGVPKGTKSDLLNLADSADYLQGFRRKPSKVHDDLLAYDSWGELMKDVDKGDVTAAKIARLFGGEEQSAETRGVIQKMSEGNFLNKVNVSEEDGKIVVSDKVDWGAQDLSREIASIRTGERPRNLRDHNALAKTEGLKALGFRGSKGDDGKFFWTANANALRSDPEKSRIFDSLTKDPDVVISTAHKSKGLEWDRVQIGDDFAAPDAESEDPETREMPPREEILLSYVALTRARKELGMGSLSWIDPSAGEDESNNEVPGRDTEEDDSEQTPSEIARKAMEEVESAERADEDAPEDHTTAAPDTEDDLDKEALETTLDEAGVTPADLEDGTVPEDDEGALFPMSLLDSAETPQDKPKRERASRPTTPETTEQEMLPGFDGDEEAPEPEAPEAPSEPRSANDLMDGIIEVEKNNVGGNENTKWDTTAVYRDEQTGKVYNGEAKYIGKGQSGEYKNSNHYRAVIRDEDGNVVAEKSGATSEITRIMPRLVNEVATKDREDADNNAPEQEQDSESTQPENAPEDAAQAPTEGADSMTVDPETGGISINEDDLPAAIERAREAGDQALLDRLTDMDQFGNRRSVARNKYDRLSPTEGKSRLTGHNLRAWWGRNDREAQDEAINKFERRAAGARQEIDRLLNSDEFVRLADLNRALAKHRRAVQDLNTAKQLRDPDWMELDRGVTRTERAVQAFKDKRAQERQERQRQAAERRKGNLGAYMKYFDGLDKDSPERKALEYYVNKMNEIMKRTNGDLSGTATGRILSNFAKAIQRQRAEALTGKPNNMTQGDANLAMKGQERTNAPAEKRHESQYTGSMEGSDLIKYPGTEDRFISKGDVLLYHYYGYRIVGEDGKMQDNYVPVEVVDVGAIGSGDVHVVPLEGHEFVKERLNSDGQIEVVERITREDILARASNKNSKGYIKANPDRLLDPNSSMSFINPTVDNGKGARSQSNDGANWRTADGLAPEKGMRVRYTMEKLRDGDEYIEQEGILFTVNSKNGAATIAKVDKDGNPLLINPEGNFSRDNIIKDFPSLKYVVSAEYDGPAPSKLDVASGNLPDLPDNVFRDPDGMATARRGGETEAERLRSIEWGTRTEQTPDEEDLVEDVNPISNKPAAPAENITPSALVPVPKDPTPSGDSEAPFTAKVEEDSEEAEGSEPTGAEEVRSAKVEPKEESSGEEEAQEPRSAKVQPRKKSLRETNPAVFAFFNYLRENSEDLAESAAVANRINQLAKASKSDRAMAGLVVRPRKASQFSENAEFFTNDPARLAKVLDYYSAIAQRNNMPVPKGVSALRKDLDEFNNRMSDSAKVDARRGVAQSLLADLQRRNYIDIVDNGEVKVLKLDEASNHIKETVAKISADIKELRKHPNATREMREAVFSRIEGVQDVEKALNDIVKEKAVKDGEDEEDVTTIQKRLYVDLEDDA